MTHLACKLKYVYLCAQPCIHALKTGWQAGMVLANIWKQGVQIEVS